jgi:hypothetical protein
MCTVDRQVHIWADIAQWSWPKRQAQARIKPAPRKKGPIKKPPDKPLPMPDTA